jgi:hypothetical protein
LTLAGLHCVISQKIEFLNLLFNYFDFNHEAPGFVSSFAEKVLRCHFHYDYDCYRNESVTIA